MQSRKKYIGEKKTDFWKQQQQTNTTKVGEEKYNGFH